MMLAACSIFSLTACGGDDNGGGSSKGDDGDNQNPTETVIFAKGADISWVTEMEKSGMKFYNANGKQTDCFELMKDGTLSTRRRRRANRSSISSSCSSDR